MNQAKIRIKKQTIEMKGIGIDYNIKMNYFSYEFLEIMKTKNYSDSSSKYYCKHQQGPNVIPHASILFSP